MELLRGGELLHRLGQHHSFTEAKASALFQQLLSAISFMHQKRIVHRDLKPEVRSGRVVVCRVGGLAYTHTHTHTHTQNILFTSEDEDATLKVVDFGFARVLPEAPSTLTTPCYTLAYAAPEVLSSSPSDGYTEACDLWSLGVILVRRQHEYVCVFVWS